MKDQAGILTQVSLSPEFMCLTITLPAPCSPMNNCRVSSHLQSLFWRSAKTKKSAVSISLAISSVQFSRSVVSNSLWPHKPQHARPPCPSPTPGVHLNPCALSWWCNPTISSSVVPFSSCLQSFPASVFSNESAVCIRWPKYWSFSLNISPSNEYPGLISFKMDWLEFLAVQGARKSLFQHHSSRASILRCSAFFIVQLSHPYMTTGKTMALTRWFDLGLALTGLISLMSYVSVVPYSGPTNIIPRILCKRSQRG